MRPAPCVVSVAEHTGCAYLVCVAAPGNVPAVVDRRRVALIDQGLPTMPYEHETTAMREEEANYSGRMFGRHALAPAISPKKTIRRRCASTAINHRPHVGSI